VIGMAESTTTHKRPDCDGYRVIDEKTNRPSASGSTFSIAHTAIEEHVVAFDSRTGKEIAKKSFMPTGGCPSYVSGPEANAIVSRPYMEDINKWLLSLAGGGTELASSDSPAKKRARRR
jgi:hypothetical protein